jgi:hypothetical protein
VRLPYNNFQSSFVPVRARTPTRYRILDPYRPSTERKSRFKYAQTITPSPSHNFIRDPSIMVLGILTAIAACPAIIGTTEAVRQGQRQNAREKHRGLKTNLSISCSRATRSGREIDQCEVVLSENKVKQPLPGLRPTLVASCYELHS